MNLTRNRDQPRSGKTLRFQEDLWERLRDRANYEHRTITELLEYAAIEYLRAVDYQQKIHEMTEVFSPPPANRGQAIPIR